MSWIFITQIFQSEIKRAKTQKEMPNELRLKAMANPDQMWNLRMRFLEQAKKYFGIPYAKKYWTKEGIFTAPVG